MVFTRRGIRAMTVACIASVTISAASAAQQAAPKANTEKLLLSLQLSGTSLTSDDLSDEKHSGGGFSAQVGWGFSRLFTLLVDGSGAVMDSDEENEFVLVHFDLLGRFNFTSPQRAWVPYVEGGVSARVAGQDNATVEGPSGTQQANLEISGGGLTFGGGLQYYVAPAWAFGAGLRWTVGEFSTVKFNSVSVDGFELDATSTRLNLGITWRPMLRRR